MLKEPDFWFMQAKNNKSWRYLRSSNCSLLKIDPQSIICLSNCIGL